MKRKLFLFDIDGTLYDVENALIPPSTIFSLQELAKHHHLGIATGRSEFMLFPIDEIIHFFNDFVLVNGQYIKSDKQVVYADKINKDLINKLCLDMDKLNITYGFQNIYEEAISNLNENVINLFQKIGLKIPKEDKNYYLNNDVYQMFALCDQEKANILKDKHQEFQFIRWLNIGFDILPKKANKWQGVLRLINYLGIEIQDVVAFGDGDNDVEVIQNAGIGIAMGNGTKNAKKVANYITTSVDKDGIYNALKYYNFI